MVSFYPKFEVEKPGECEIVIMMDRSASMKGPTFSDAKVPPRPLPPPSTFSVGK